MVLQPVCHYILQATSLDLNQVYLVTFQMSPAAGSSRLGLTANGHLVVVHVVALGEDGGVGGECREDTDGTAPSLR